MDWTPLYQLLTSLAVIVIGAVVLALPIYIMIDDIRYEKDRKAAEKFEQDYIRSAIKAIQEGKTTGSTWCTICSGFVIPPHLH